MSPASSQSASGASRPIRIFLVEDQALFSSLLREILTNHPGFTVVGQAATAADALATLEAAAPDLVLVDLLLPDMSGLELIERLMGRKPAYKIVVCSAACHDRAIAMAFALGAHGFVEKNRGLSELLDALERTMQGSICLSPRVSEVLRQQAGFQSDAPSLRPGDLGILRRLLRHEPARAIARDVGMSASGIYKVRERIARRTGVRSKRELYEVAVEFGLMPAIPEEPVPSKPRAAVGPGGGQHA